ncbi:helix-turn-helix domain-containing protein [Limnohabitans sp.]|jgi:excisionase family DNA binding protein|uniref:helix-turn-helix domain-containing protein n=1 Tax=Limnohabitans sp. TaxID=1907725 RepID=UPI0039BCC613|nr:helix-turn-helix domain-containing protein [Comamonadaceae bacterium]
MLNPSTLQEPKVQQVPSSFLSTAAAAKMLGLSTTLVQTLVDQGDLKGWKTRGGHRRISAESIQDYQRQASSSITRKLKMANTLKISVVVDDTGWVESFKSDLSQWKLPIEVVFFESVTEAILDLSAHRPDMVVIEMSMPLVQQEKTLKALENFNKRGTSPLSVVIITQEKGLISSIPNGADSSIQLVSGPISAVWLHAYLIGILASAKMR